MELKELFIESFKEFKNRPSIFIPKLISSLIGALWMLFVLDSLTSGNLQNMYLSLIAFVPVYLAGIWAPIIVAEMVKDLSFIEASKSSLSYFSRILLFSILLFGLMALTLIPFYLGLGITIIFGNIITVIYGGMITFALSLGLIYLIYFVPVTLTENNLHNTLKKSWNTSEKYKKEVTSLIIFSFALLIFASLSTGTLQILGAAGFIIGRIASSLLSTYIYILSPKFYIEEAN